MEPYAKTDEHIAAVLTESKEPIAQFFSYTHLPPDLGAVSRPFAALAAHLVVAVPRNAERTVALRKLLEGKDAAVRAFIAKDVPR